MSDRRGDFISKRHSTTYDFITPLQLILSDIHVLITGTAFENGVGYATATAFARAGASSIALVDLHAVPNDLVTKLRLAASRVGRRREPDIYCFKLDISDPDAVKAMHEDVMQKLNGRIDVVVNNAAHMEPYKPFLESDLNTHWRTWEVNIRGLLNISHTFLPSLLSSRNANPRALCTMLNVSSSGALTARAGSSSYRSSKLAIMRFTESIALEYAGQGLITYCVNPGAIKTSITEGSVPEQVRDRLPDSPDVAGDTIVWLVSKRREWLGGRYMSCNWDMEELVGRRAEIVEGDLLKMEILF